MEAPLRAHPVLSCAITMESSMTLKTSDIYIYEHFFELSNFCNSSLLQLYLWIPNLSSKVGSYILYFTTAQRINRL